MLRFEKMKQPLSLETIFYVPQDHVVLISWRILGTEISIIRYNYDYENIPGDVNGISSV